MPFVCAFAFPKLEDMCLNVQTIRTAVTIMQWSISVSSRSRLSASHRLMQDELMLYHGYPWLVHRLTYRRTNPNLHVRGYKEEGTITTAFDIRVQNELDRCRLVRDVVDRLPHLGTRGDYLKQLVQDQLIEHKQYIDQHGEDHDHGHREAQPEARAAGRSEDSAVAGSGEEAGIVARRPHSDRGTEAVDSVRAE